MREAVDRITDLPFALWLVGISSAWYICRNARKDWFAPINLVMGLFFWFFFLVPIGQSALNVLELRYTSDREFAIERAEWVALLGIVSFAAGYKFTLSRSLMKSIATVSALVNHIDRRRLDLPIIACYIVGLLALLSHYGTGGGLECVIESRSAVVGARWWVTPLFATSTVSCVMAYCYWGCGRGWFPAILTISMVAVLFGLRVITGRRAWALEPIVLVLFAARYLERKFRPTLVMGILAVGVMTCLVVYFGDYRSDASVSSMSSVRAAVLAVLDQTERLEALTWVMEFIPAQVPYNRGVGFLGEAFPLIFGRVFGKAGITWFHTGYVTTLAVGPGTERAGAASTCLGTLYHEFGLCGIAVGLCLIGACVRMMYQGLIVNQRSSGSVVLYVLVLYLVFLFIVGGSWQAFYHTQLQVLVVSALFLLANGRGDAVRKRPV